MCKALLSHYNICVDALPRSHPANETCSTNSSSPSSSSLTSTIRNISASTIAPTSSSAAPIPSVSPNDKYVSFCGDGSPAAGWPTVSDWLDFDHLFNYNTPNMRIACEQWGVPDDSDAEIATMRSSILSVANLTAIDPRFILAVIMQESTGCVRVITTAYSHNNPGLMQSYNGTGTCNTNNAPLSIAGTSGSGTVSTPCPASMIRQQIMDATNGTVWGPGLRQNYADAGQGAVDTAQIYYRTARIYNGGQYAASDMSQPCCTTSYVSDIANRLLGWVHAPREFTCT